MHHADFQWAHVAAGRARQTGLFYAGREGDGPMKTSLEHLPPNRQDKVRAIARLIRDAAPVDMIILYGSFAREDEWVDDPVGGYFSDFDVAIIVKDSKLANKPRLWTTVEQNAQRLSGRASVSLIVHDIRDINHHLRGGHYFFTDLVKDGIMLYDSGRLKLARAQESTPAQRLSFARACFREYFAEADWLYELFEFCLQNERYKRAAFELHQATEMYYKTMILVFTAYRPKEHNLENLGKQCADLHPDLREVFPAGPAATAEDEHRVKLLKQAYVDARYSMNYRITREELEWLAGHVRELRARVERACQERIAALAAAAGQAPTAP
jgi:uncharacterized protein